MKTLPLINPYLEEIVVSRQLPQKNTESLYFAFMDLCKNSNIPQDAAIEMWLDIAMKHSEIHRVYHHMSHLFSLWSLMQPYKGHINRPDLMLWAIFYHDYEYILTAKDNEAQSAKKALQALKPYLSFEELQYIQALILATANHTLPTKESFVMLEDNFIKIILEDTAFFLDFDMAILASPEAIYIAYAQAIAAEYGQVFTPENYKKGRSLVLENFINRKDLFFSPLKDSLQVLAQYNLSLELKSYQR